MKNESTITHIRRCHVCGEVNETEHGTVRRCSGCGKHLAPFYYFDESKCVPFGDRVFSDLITVEEEKPDSHKQEDRVYNPIWGLSAFWGN